jgi:hypothetical protein
MEEEPPDEPLPLISDLNNGNDDDDDDDDNWIDVDDQVKTSGEVLYQHFLDERNSISRPFASRGKEPQDYATRLAKEQANWEAQKEELTEAYMAFRVNGSLMEEEGEGTDWFTCKIIDIKGMIHQTHYLIPFR